MTSRLHAAVILTAATVGITCCRPAEKGVHEAVPATPPPAARDVAARPPAPTPTPNFTARIGGYTVFTSPETDVSKRKVPSRVIMRHSTNDYEKVSKKRIPTHYLYVETETATANLDHNDPPTYRSKDDKRVAWALPKGRLVLMAEPRPEAPLRVDASFDSVVQMSDVCPKCDLLNNFRFASAKDATFLDLTFGRLRVEDKLQFGFAAAEGDSLYNEGDFALDVLLQEQLPAETVVRLWNLNLKFPVGSGLTLTIVNAPCKLGERECGALFMPQRATKGKGSKQADHHFEMYYKLTDKAGDYAVPWVDKSKMLYHIGPRCVPPMRVK